MGIVRRLSHQKKLSIIPKLIETIFTVKMMKRMLMFICLIASIGSTFAENCKPGEICCDVQSRFHMYNPRGCAKCCKVQLPGAKAIAKAWAKLVDGMNEMNEMKQRNDPDWTIPVECKPSEHCCRKSAAGGCAKCCPNRIQMGAWPYGGM